MKNALKNITRLLGDKHRETDSPEETRQRMIKLMKYKNSDFEDDK